jgi:hypothetical protein
MVFNAIFNNISVILWRTVSYIDGGNLSIRRKPLTCRKSLTNFITYVVSSTTRNEWDLNSQL